MGRTLEQKLVEQVDRDPKHNGCHIWTGGFGQWGTPSTYYLGRIRSVRKLVWERLHGPMPEHRQATTTCGVNACLSPEHITIRVIGGDIDARFWEKVDENGPMSPVGRCWKWLAAHQKGYPIFHPTERTRVGAHRKMYELRVGKIPTDDGEWCVCHRCDNPGCVNPEHLFLGRDLDNIRDAISKGRMAWQRKPKSVAQHCSGPTSGTGEGEKR